MTKAQKKLKAEMTGTGWREIEKQTDVSMNTLYAYIRSEERCMSMKMSTAKKFLELYGIEFCEWWEEYEVLAVCEACRKDIISEDDWKSDSEGVDFCEVCFAELLDESQGEELE